MARLREAREQRAWEPHLAGVPVPDSCQGQDLSRLVLGGQAPHESTQLIMNALNSHQLASNPFHSDLYRGVVSERYTYTVRVDGPWLLFENQNDPMQQTNLIASPEHAATRKDLHAKLATWLEKSKDPFPLSS